MYYNRVMRPSSPSQIITKKKKKHNLKTVMFVHSTLNFLEALTFWLSSLNRHITCCKKHLVSFNCDGLVLSQKQAAIWELHKETRQHDEPIKQSFEAAHSPLRARRRKHPEYHQLRPLWTVDSRAGKNSVLFYRLLIKKDVSPHWRDACLIRNIVDYVDQCFSNQCAVR